MSYFWFSFFISKDTNSIYKESCWDDEGLMFLCGSTRVQTWNPREQYFCISYTIKKN